MLAIRELPPTRFRRTLSQFFPAARIPAKRVPACRARRALSSGMQFVEFKLCSEDLHRCSVFSSVPFRSVK